MEQKTESEVQAARIVRIKKVINDNKAKQEKRETILDEIHSVLYIETDDRQWKILKMALWTKANIVIDNNKFIINNWDEFDGIDFIMEIIIEAIEQA